MKYIDAAGNGTYYNFDGWALSTDNRNKPTVLTDKIYNNENDLDFYAVYRISKATAAKLVVEGKASSAEVGRIDLTQ